MPTVSQPDAVSSKAAPKADVGAASASLGTTDLGSAATGMTLQLWLEEVRARLKSYMEYPDSAIQTMQSEGVMQDTVTLKFSAQLAPAVGGVAGSTINYIFIDHFQDKARGHFIVRRLERAHGPDAVRAAYDTVRAELVATRQIKA